MVVITGGATGRHLPLQQHHHKRTSTNTSRQLGIGLMMTKAFALNGAHKVYIIGRRKDKLDETAKLSPTNIVPIVGDVTSKASLTSIAAQIKQETGYINLICCNSGTMPPAVSVKPSSATSVADYARAALELDPQDWATTFATNSTAIAFTTFAFLELLDEGNQRNNAPGRKSQVLVTTSIAGYLRNPGSNLAYGASKAAATHLIKHLAGTLAPVSIRVNGIAPGLFPSDLAEGLIAGVGAKGDPGEEGSIDATVIPATRTGVESDMVGTVMWIASRAGAYLNGNVTVLDGGRVSQLPGTY